MRRHGTYLRKAPQGLRIPRWYCRQGHCTFSLLPDFAAARLPATLDAIEEAVVRFEEERAQGTSVEQAARTVHPRLVGAQAAVRWMGRRRRWVRAALTLLAGFDPMFLAACALQLHIARRVLETSSVLVRVREVAATSLRHAPAPVGLAVLLRRGKRPAKPAQHTTGPDPPRPGELHPVSA